MKHCQLKKSPDPIQDLAFQFDWIRIQIFEHPGNCTDPDPQHRNIDFAEKRELVWLPTIQ